MIFNSNGMPDFALNWMCICMYGHVCFKHNIMDTRLCWDVLHGMVCTSVTADE